MLSKNKKSRGFMVLVSAIIFSLILLAISVTLSLTGYLGRSNILDSESKERSLALAEACADTAILKASQSLSYAVTSPPGATVTVQGTDTCTIYSVTRNSPGSGQTTIKTQATINKSTSNIQVVVNDTDFSIISWEEIPSL